MNVIKYGSVFSMKPRPNYTPQQASPSDYLRCVCLILQCQPMQIQERLNSRVSQVVKDNVMQLGFSGDEFCDKYALFCMISHTFRHFNGNNQLELIQGLTAHLRKETQMEISDENTQLAQYCQFVGNKTQFVVKPFAYLDIKPDKTQRNSVSPDQIATILYVLHHRFSNISLKFVNIYKLVIHCKDVKFNYKHKDFIRLVDGHLKLPVVYKYIVATTKAGQKKANFKVNPSVQRFMKSSKICVTQRHMTYTPYRQDNTLLPAFLLNYTRVRPDDIRSVIDNWIQIKSWQLVVDVKDIHPLQYSDCMIVQFDGNQDDDMFKLHVLCCVFNYQFMLRSSKVSPFGKGYQFLKSQLMIHGHDHLLTTQTVKRIDIIMNISKPFHFTQVGKSFMYQRIQLPSAKDFFQLSTFSSGGKLVVRKSSPSELTQFLCGPSVSRSIEKKIMKTLKVVPPIALNLYYFKTQEPHQQLKKAVADNDHSLVNKMCTPFGFHTFQQASEFPLPPQYYENSGYTTYRELQKVYPDLLQNLFAFLIHGAPRTVNLIVKLFIDRCLKPRLNVGPKASRDYFRKLYRSKYQHTNPDYDPSITRILQQFHSAKEQNNYRPINFQTPCINLQVEIVRRLLTNLQKHGKTKKITSLLENNVHKIQKQKEVMYTIAINDNQQPHSLMIVN